MLLTSSRLWSKLCVTIVTFASNPQFQNLFISPLCHWLAAALWEDSAMSVTWAFQCSLDLKYNCIHVFIHHSVVSVECFVHFVFIISIHPLHFSCLMSLFLYEAFESIVYFTEYISYDYCYFPTDTQSNNSTSNDSMIYVRETFNMFTLLHYTSDTTLIPITQAHAQQWFLLLGWQDIQRLLCFLFICFSIRGTSGKWEVACIAQN